jgi:hypothetical protein
LTAAKRITGDLISIPQVIDSSDIHYKDDEKSKNQIKIGKKKIFQL